MWKGNGVNASVLGSASARTRTVVVAVGERDAAVSAGDCSSCRKYVACAPDTGQETPLF